jgi:hypothetical protein
MLTVSYQLIVQGVILVLQKRFDISATTEIEGVSATVSFGFDSSSSKQAPSFFQDEYPGDSVQRFAGLLAAQLPALLHSIEKAVCQSLAEAMKTSNDELEKTVR